MGIENVPPIITRGICLDVSGLDGTAHLAAGSAVTTEDLKGAYDTAKINPQKRDMVSLNTGSGEYCMSNNEKYLAGEPGLGINAAHWLTKQDTIAAAADNYGRRSASSNQSPLNNDAGSSALFGRARCSFFGNFNFLELIQYGISAFCLIMLSIKLRGATGCPVRPITVI